jgi:threonine/homoserine/homoserine lactone efflux protein
MLKYLLLGSGYAFAAAIQPGPLQAFLAARVVAVGWRRTLPACLAPLLSDGPIALAALVLLDQLSQTAQEILRAAGGLLLGYLAWTAFRQWRNPTDTVASQSAPRTVLEAALVNVTNPNPYLGWALVLGPSVHTAMLERPAHAVVLIAAFYATMVLMLAGFIYLVGTVRFLGSRAQRALVGASAAVLGVLGLYLLGSAVWALAAV